MQRQRNYAATILSPHVLGRAHCALKELFHVSAAQGSGPFSAVRPGAASSDHDLAVGLIHLRYAKCTARAR